MTLNTETADQIVAVVAKDHICRARIEGPTLKGLLSRLHIAGSVRNLALLTVMTREDPLFVRMCCLGIAEATRDAIFAGKMAGVVSGVSVVSRVERVHNGCAHKATRVTLEDQTEYVFDWFPTLEPENPMVYRLKDWRVDAEGVEYVDFDGFDDGTN